MSHSHLAVFLITLSSLQSGVRHRHGTETALLRALNYILFNAVLVLLALTAAFHTADHSILISRLREWVGISVTILNCFLILFIWSLHFWPQASQHSMHAKPFKAQSTGSRSHVHHAAKTYYQIQFNSVLDIYAMADLKTINVLICTLQVHVLSNRRLYCRECPWRCLVPVLLKPSKILFTYTEKVSPRIVLLPLRKLFQGFLSKAFRRVSYCLRTVYSWC